MSQSPPSTEEGTSMQGLQSGDAPTEQVSPAEQPSAEHNISGEQNAVPSPAPNISDTSTSADLVQLGEFKYYTPNPNRAGNSFREEPSSDFFEPTPEDLRSAQASLASRSRAYQEAPLLTEKLRNERNRENRAKFPTTTIRIMFADRSVLEKTFPSSSVIKPVYAFVRLCLREDAKVHKFVLFESPPRRDLKVSDPNVRDKSLFDLHLAPRSILHFRFFEDTVKLDPITGPPPLHPEILSRAIELPLPVSPETTSSPPAQAFSKATGSTDSSDKSRKLARLLRLPGKR